MNTVWTYSADQSTWSPAKPERPAQPPCRDDQPPAESYPKCPRCHSGNKDAKGASNAPNLGRNSTLWCAGRLNAAMAARILPPVSSDKPNSNSDLQYRNPAGQLVTRPNIANEEEIREMSDIEWAVQNVVRRKYPEIHYEIVIAALEHAGHIQPGADPDFPNSVMATVPPEPPNPEAPA